MTGPSRNNDRATSKQVYIPTVLAVGCSEALLARCFDCLVGMGVMVRDCEPEHAATLAAVRHPLVIVVARAVYDLDPGELEALARDVRATLLSVGDDVGEQELDASLAAAVRARTRHRDGRSTGRYSVLPGEMMAHPTAVTASEPPPVSAVRVAPIVLEPLDDASSPAAVDQRWG